MHPSVELSDKFTHEKHLISVLQDQAIGALPCAYRANTAIYPKSGKECESDAERITILGEEMVEIYRKLCWGPVLHYCTAVQV